MFFVANIHTCGTDFRMMKQLLITDKVEKDGGVPVECGGQLLAAEKEHRYSDF